MRFGQQIILTYLVRLLLIPLGVLNAVIIARWLGPSGKGIFAAVTTYLAMAGMFSNFGLSIEATRVAATDVRRTGSILANARLTGAVAGLGALAALLALRQLLGDEAFDGLPPSLLLIAGLALPFSLAASQFQAVLLGRRRVAAYNGMEAADRLALFAASLLLLVGFGLNVTALVAAATVLAVAKLVAYHWLLSPESRCFKVDLGLLRSMSRVSLRAYVACLLSFLVLRSDIVLINGMLGAEATGVYSVAVQLAGFLLMLPMAVGTLLFPRVAAAPDEKSALFTALVSRHLALVVTVACLVLLVAGGWLVGVLFGPAFLEAGLALQILLPGVWCVALQAILANDLSGRDYPLVLPLVWGIALVVNVGLNIWWLPLYGIAGAAASSSVAYALSFLLVAGYWLRRFPGIGPVRLLVLRGSELRRIPERLRQTVLGGDRSSQAT